MITTKEFLTGSRAFFDGMDGFEPHDTDILVLTGRGFGAQWAQSSIGETTRFIHHHTGDTDAFIASVEALNQPNAVCMLLDPQIAEHVGFTAEMLERIRPMAERCEGRHLYLRKIYEYYVRNGSLTLNAQQRAYAFKVYKESRNQINFLD